MAGMGETVAGGGTPGGISLGRAAAARLRLRRVLLGTGAIGLAAGVWAGLVRMGWALPGRSSHLAAEHGPLLVIGFFASLIGLERAVALGRGWAFAGPSAAALSIVALLAGVPSLVVRTSATLAVAGVALVFAYLAWRAHMLHLGVMLAGTLAWVWGNLGWLAGWPLGEVVPAWLAGDHQDEAGERLELGRFMARRGVSRQQFRLRQPVFSSEQRSGRCGRPVLPVSSASDCWRSPGGCCATTSRAVASVIQGYIATAPSACSPAMPGSGSAGCSTWFGGHRLAGCGTMPRSTR